MTQEKAATQICPQCGKVLEKTWMCCPQCGRNLTLTRERIESLKAHLSEITERNKYKVRVDSEDLSVPSACLTGWIYEEGKLEGGIISILVLGLIAPLVQKSKERKVLWFSFGGQNDQFTCRIEVNEMNKGYARKLADTLTKMNLVNQAEITILPRRH